MESKVNLCFKIQYEQYKFILNLKKIKCSLFLKQKYANFYCADTLNAKLKVFESRTLSGTSDTAIKIMQ